LLNTQGQFAEKDNESNETFFELRNYDPLLGRFNTIDPYGQYFSPYLAMGNSHSNMIDPDGGYSASNPFLGTGGFGSGGTSGLQILGSVSGVISAAMMGNAFAFQNAVGELNASVSSYTTPVRSTYSAHVDINAKDIIDWANTPDEGEFGGPNVIGGYGPDFALGPVVSRSGNLIGRFFKAILRSILKIKATKLVTLPKLGIKYFDEINDLSSVSKGQLVSYARQFEIMFKEGKIGALTRDQASILVKQAKKLGVDVRIDKGHSKTFWNMDHLNIGPSGYHVPILSK